MKTIQVQTVYGPMYVLDNDSIVGKSLRMYGEWAQLELEFLAQIIKPGQTVLDVGANVGTHTVAFAQMVGPTGCVISFEPQRLPFQLLCANVTANNLHNVWAQNAAIGNEDGICKIVSLDYEMESNNFGACRMARNSDGGSVVQADISRLDSLNLPSCSLIKADIEGGELDMLRGAASTIERCQPILYLEHHDNRDEVVAFLAERGYRVHLHRTPTFNKHNFAGCDENIFASATEDNIVCFPRHVEVDFLPVSE